MQGKQQQIDSHGLTPVALQRYGRTTWYSSPRSRPGSPAGSCCPWKSSELLRAEGEAGYPLAGGALPVEGATRAGVQNCISSHSEREGEAPTALLVEGATRAPLIEGKRKKEILLVALGGNALIRKGEAGTVEEQFRNLKVPIKQIARLSGEYRIIITHGNGPQVGNLLLQQEKCSLVPPLPLEILVAQTQGEIGYMIESTLDSELMLLGTDTQKHLVSLISYVVVDENDPAFRDPSKPIGPVYTAEKAAVLPYPTRKTPKGYRRVVASPQPITIVEKREIKKLINMDFLVVCCGGGGIPVIREGRTFCGVDAVIDKDLASAVLAREVGVDIFVIATDVEGVALHYGKPNEKFLRKLTVLEAAQYRNEGHFPPGSMGPKVEAATKFVKGGGKRAVITSIETIEEAVWGRAGTEIISG